jgi:hypothetical protein
MTITTNIFDPSVLAAFGIKLGGSSFQLPTTNKTSYSTAQTTDIVVPNGVTKLGVKAWGAGASGVGSYAEAILDVIPGETLTLVVGSAGVNATGDVGAVAGPHGGGGNGGNGAQNGGSSGAGFSGVLRGSTALLIAAGAGGKAATQSTLNGSRGGDGDMGGVDAQTQGINYALSACGGKCGGLYAYDNGGNYSFTGTATPTARGANGASLQGGAGGVAAGGSGGGGGGGGYFGGGGGGAGGNLSSGSGDGRAGGGGGGGSSYVDPSVSYGKILMSNVPSTAPKTSDADYVAGRAGVNQDGLLVITY